MNRHCTTFNTRDSGEQVDTQALRRQRLIPRAIPTFSHPDRYSLVWFGRIALLWAAGSAAVGFVIGLLGR
jgi:hypothetical protein